MDGNDYQNFRTKKINPSNGALDYMSDNSEPFKETPYYARCSVIKKYCHIVNIMMK